MMRNDSRKRLIIEASGLVQGVFFRFEAQKKAKELDLTGWVKNLPNGRVKIVAEGDEDSLNKLKEWFRNGPEYARVEKVESVIEPATGEFDSFEIRY